MTDATLAQGHRLTELILREQDPYTFAQNLHGNWGAVQKFGRGEVDQATFEAALQMYFNTQEQHYGMFGRQTHPDNPWKDKKLDPKLFYPTGYKTNSPKRQLQLLQATLGQQLDTTGLEGYIKGLGQAPNSADGRYPYLAVRRKTLARFAGSDTIDRHNFAHILEQTAFVGLQRKLGSRFKNWREGQMGPEYHRILETTWIAQDRLEAEQPEGDVVAYWAQSGRLGAGCAPGLCRFEIDQATNPSQWNWSLWEGIMCVITNPHRLADDKHLVIDLPGDEISLDADGTFDFASFLDFDGGQLHFSYGWIRNPDGSCGSASAFSR